MELKKYTRDINSLKQLFIRKKNYLRNLQQSKSKQTN